MLGIGVSLRYPRGGAAPAPAPDPIALLFAHGEAGDEWLFERDFCYTLSGGGVYERVTTTGDQIARVTGRHNGINADQINVPSRPIYNEGGGLSWGFFEIDDFLVTPTITPGTDKAQICAGVRKLSDAALGVIAGLTASVSTTGALTLDSRRYAAGDYAMTIRNASANSVQNFVNYPAPITSVLSALYDQAGANIDEELSLRANGALSAKGGTGLYNAGSTDFASSNFYIGSQGGASAFLNANIYSLTARFGPRPDLSTIQDVESYYASKTGVTL